jgi:hypothetical protein
VNRSSPTSRGTVHELAAVVGSPDGGAVGRDAELGEARHVVHVAQLEMADRVACAQRAVAQLHSLDGVERAAHARITTRVHVRVESGQVGSGHMTLDELGLEDERAVVVGLIGVRLEQRGGVLWPDTVQEQLQRGDRQVGRSDITVQLAQSHHR